MKFVLTYTYVGTVRLVRFQYRQPEITIRPQKLFVGENTCTQQKVVITYLNTADTATGSHYIAHRVTLDVVPLSGFLSKQQNWNARHKTTKKTEKHPRLSKIVGCLVSQTGTAEAGAAA